MRDSCQDKKSGLLQRIVRSVRIARFYDPWADGSVAKLNPWTDTGGSFPAFLILKYILYSNSFYEIT